MQDPWTPKEGRRVGRVAEVPREKPDDYADGPILTFIEAADVKFERLILLHDPPTLANGALDAIVEALTKRHPEMAVQPQYLPTENPRDYEALYKGVRAVCEKARATLDPKMAFHIFLSPGTPQMHATWVLLAKTVFPSTTWQGSDRPNQSRAERVHIPFDLDAELLEPAKREGLSVDSRMNAVDMVAESPAMRKALATAIKVADSHIAVLLLGESGVGKELMARAIHQNSPRKNHRFVVANCGALMPTLIEDELFGHVRGAFNEAVTDRPGLFEAATGGTIFLDEIGEVPLELQTRFLRVLQEHTVRRTGSNHEISVDVRVVAATNRDLLEMVQQKSFRKDLYYRLNVVQIEIPPLRDRSEDILPLAEKFLKDFNAKPERCSKPPARLLPSAKRRLQTYPWPGNVRELRNRIQQFVVLTETGRIDGKALDDALPPPMLSEIITGLDFDFKPGRGLKEILNEIERRILKEAYERFGSQAKAAKSLGIGSQQAFYKRWHAVGLTKNSALDKLK